MAMLRTVRAYKVEQVGYCEGEVLLEARAKCPRDGCPGEFLAYLVPTWVSDAHCQCGENFWISVEYAKADVPEMRQVVQGSKRPGGKVECADCDMIDPERSGEGHICVGQSGGPPQSNGEAFAERDTARRQEDTEPEVLIKSEAVDVARLNLRPGDILVMTYHGALSGDMAASIRRGVETDVPGHQCLVVSECVSVTKRLRKKGEDDANSATGG